MNLMGIFRILLKTLDLYILNLDISERKVQEENDTEETIVARGAYANNVSIYLALISDLYA